MLESTTPARRRQKEANLSVSESTREGRAVSKVEHGVTVHPPAVLICLSFDCLSSAWLNLVAFDTSTRMHAFNENALQISRKLQGKNHPYSSLRLNQLARRPLNRDQQ